MAKGILKYRLYQRENKENPEEDAKWYARSAPDRTMDFEDLVSHMSEHNSPYSRGVIHGVLTDMLDCVKELVLDGKNVRLGDLGLFSVGISSKGALTSEMWKGALTSEMWKVATHLRGVHLKVRNTKTWSNTELRNSCTIEELSKYTTGDEEAKDETGGGEADA